VAVAVVMAAEEVMVTAEAEVVMAEVEAASMAVAQRSMAAASDQAARRFIPAAFEPVALHSEAARSSTAAACDSLTGITFTDGSSTGRPTTPITPTIPITTRIAAAASSRLTTVHAASATSATGGTITGVITTGAVITTIATTGEHRHDRGNESGAQRRPFCIPCQENLSNPSS
jgi:hypothetical protein